jgi:hypothetical protein
MEKQEAHKILTDVCMVYKGTRGEHIVIQKALDALKPVPQKNIKPDKK